MYCSIEPQTRKLFAVARLRGLPVFTFVNKMDRPALNGFEIIEQLEKEFNLQSYPVTWPIGSGVNNSCSGHKQQDTYHQTTAHKQYQA